jgi:hypothetical protein
MKQQCLLQATPVLPLGGSLGTLHQTGALPFYSSLFQSMPNPV